VVVDFCYNDNYRSECDYVTLVLDDFRMVAKVRVLTGHPGTSGRDILQRGVLEISLDGINFQRVAVFSGGEALFSPESPMLLKSVRIQVTADQGDWLVLREIVLE
jgi:hypothetical protein